MRYKRDHYEALGVSPKASEEEIRVAHRVRAVFSHRRGVLRVQDKMQQLEEARDVLTDQDKRREFDRLREVFVLAPRRAWNEAETERLRREGRLRRGYSRKVAHDCRRIGQVSLAESGSMTRLLFSPSPPRAIDAVGMRVQAAPWRRLAWFAAGIGVGAALITLLLLLRQSGQL